MSKRETILRIILDISSDQEIHWTQPSFTNRLFRWISIFQGKKKQVIKKFPTSSTSKERTRDPLMVNYVVNLPNVWHLFLNPEVGLRQKFEVLQPLGVFVYLFSDFKLRTSGEMALMVMFQKNFQKWKEWKTENGKVPLEELPIGFLSSENYSSDCSSCTYTHGLPTGHV